MSAYYVLSRDYKGGQIKVPFPVKLVFWWGWAEAGRQVNKYNDPVMIIILKKVQGSPESDHHSASCLNLA